MPARRHRSLGGTAGGVSGRARRWARRTNVARRSPHRRRAAWC